MAESITITLPLPDKRLHPNGGNRHNYHVIDRLKKESKTRAWAEARGAIGSRDWRGYKIQLHYRFYLGTASAAKLADKDNGIAWLKNYQDGVSDAIEVNDRYFAEPLVDYDFDGKGKRVEITILPSAMEA